ncbi:hypothetical protein PVAND_000899 [Polypedilum vanderplanki]|uniref:Sphingomyelin phosphodiesterase n=1 Tax=Polypedilum vanderplanki TaxID=319348 RepID=A0A9J6BMH5_POLVA|nr:hypothetical protein PVAND_000899 [Polypedilum vanderplanki]
MGKFLKLLVLFCAVSFALTLRTEEEIRRRDEMLRHSDNFTAAFSQEYLRYKETGVRTRQLEQMLAMMQITKEFARVEITELDAEAAIMSCVACRATVGLLLQQYRSGARDKEQIIEDSIGICIDLTSYSVIVCEGVIRLFADHLIYIVDARPALTANQMCSMVLQPECGDPDPVFDFTINVSPGPPITGPKSGSIPRNANEIKIIHITDPHYDPAYLVGGFADCPDPTCCRRFHGMANTTAARAGRWGDYRSCDSPWEVVEDALEAAHRQHPDAHLIYITGDYIDHGVWETTHAGNMAILDRFYAAVRRVFGNKPVYPVLGNHEGQPTDQFAPSHITDPVISSHWLYQHSANAWAQWLPASALTTVRRGGYYTVNNLPGFPRLRIIGLNNNDCYRMNLWVMYSRVEIAQQLQWLHDTLLAAEAAGEYVHILGHILTSGSSCFRYWSREFRRIVDRFHRIISGQFYGHSHNDEFNIYYARQQHQTAINYAWLGGATTSYGGQNPNYAVYFVDREIYQVNEKESWYYSVTEANLNEATRPVWRLHYRFREFYNLPDLSPASLDNFVTNTMSRSRNALRSYREFRSSASDFVMNQPCDDNCLRGQLCSVTRNEINDNRKCNEINNFPLS